MTVARVAPSLALAALTAMSPATPAHADGLLTDDPQLNAILLACFAQFEGGDLRKTRFGGVAWCLGIRTEPRLGKERIETLLAPYRYAQGVFLRCEPLERSRPQTPAQAARQHHEDAACYAQAAQDAATPPALQGEFQRLADEHALRAEYADGKMPGGFGF